ncbi:MAG: restriction endonuclease subunit S [Candidatus Eisenbacteria bacterium]|nr:restriction endonuclease subunit S [Candidatus Eisenbacteria bacterium]
MRARKLSPLAKFATFNPETVGKDYPFEEIEYIDISSIGSGASVSRPAVIPLGTAPSRAKRIVRDGDTIIANVRPNLRSFLFIKNPKPNTVVSTGFTVLRAREQADPRFVFYAVTDRSFTEYLSNNAKGTSYPAVDTDTFERGLVPDVSLGVQRRVGDILSAYDDLIENNQRRIKLLEESARLLYKEWFVRLRFPGYEHTRIINGVPEGWEKKKLGDLCDEIREMVSPQEVDPDTPYIGLEHIPRRSITLSTWGKAEEVTSSKHRFRAEDILFGKIRPYFHKVGITFVDGVSSSDAIVIRPRRSTLRGLVLMTMSCDPFVEVTAQTMREGSKMPRADWKQMQAYLVPLPPDGLLSSFDSFVHATVEQLKTLAFANHKLRQARDLLLPKLMNGEVEI